uniref:NADH:quinone oxidoreductase/Mrp antiporter transmembrane domain-containing protein n=1 Tax=Brassica oleracea TaxID=3712 RepID=A0A3P6G4B4_BRAOL|nr:unnamed protein product [Brassica oleracea]
MVSLGYMVHPGGEIELQEIVNGLINTQMYNSPGISIALIFITVGIGFKLSLAPSHQWTPDVYEGVRREMLSPRRPRQNFDLVRNNESLYDKRIHFASLLLRVVPTKDRTNDVYKKDLNSRSILSMILGNLIAITQTSMKRMLAYSSIGQIGYVIIGIIVGDSNGGYASMITYMLFYISMNLGTFACIILFGLRTGTDNIRDYAGLYTKDPFWLSLALCLLSLGGLPPLAVFWKTPFILVWMAGRPIFLGFNRTPYERSFYLLLSKNNQVINDWTKPRNNPHVRNYRISL